MCDQLSLRSACAYAQSDQSLCQSLEYSMTVKLLTEHHLEFLSLKGGCTGLSESTLVKMLQCWKSRVTDPNYVDDTSGQNVKTSDEISFFFNLGSHAICTREYLFLTPVALATETSYNIEISLVVASFSSMPLHAGTSFAVFLGFLGGFFGVVLRLLTLPHTPTPFSFKINFSKSSFMDIFRMMNYSNYVFRMLYPNTLMGKHFQIHKC